jgi:nucleoside-diphosphate-sugar epimerase
MTILVTGAAGLLGRHVVHAFLDRGLPIAATHRSKMGDLGDERRLDALERCELSDREAVRSLLSRLRPQTVVHCAAAIGSDGDRLLHDNVLATTVLIEESVRAGCRRFIFCSSISVYEGSVADRDGYRETQPLLPAGKYANSKLIGEQALRIAAGPSFQGCTLRLAGLHGAPRKDGVVERMLLAAEQGGRIRVDNPAGRFRLLFLTDAAQAIALAATSELPAEYACYNVASRDVFDLATLAAVVLRVTGSKSAVEIVCASGGVDQVMNIDRICRDLGYIPTGLDAALAETTARSQHPRLSA